MASGQGKVLAVSVGLPREFEYNGRPARSAIWKSPVAGRVAARGVNLAGDGQADRQAHGGPDKAVYAYAVEDLHWWAREIGRPIQYGELGENLTTEGIEMNGALVGERWTVGTTVFEVSEPRVPCWRLGARMNDKLFPRRFMEALRPGTYLRILVEGDVGAGDEIRIIEWPDHGLTIRDVLRIYAFDRQEAGRLLAVPRMSEDWRWWAEQQEAKRHTAEAACPGCHQGSVAPRRAQEIGPPLRPGPSRHRSPAVAIHGPQPRWKPHDAAFDPEISPFTETVRMEDHARRRAGGRGSGQAGNPLWQYNLTRRGWSVALIERKELGGTCVNLRVPRIIED